MGEQADDSLDLLIRLKADVADGQKATAAVNETTGAVKKGTAAVEESGKQNEKHTAGLTRCTAYSMR